MIKHIKSTDFDMKIKFGVKCEPTLASIQLRNFKFGGQKLDIGSKINTLKITDNARLA